MLQEPGGTEKRRVWRAALDGVYANWLRCRAAAPDLQHAFQKPVGCQASLSLSGSQSSGPEP